MSEGDRARFLEWLRSSRLSVEEYLATVEVESALVEVMPALNLHDEHLLARAQAELASNVASLDDLGAAPPGNRSRSRWLPLVLGAALLAAISLGFLLWRDANGRITVDRGEQRTVQLPDGSTLHINSGSTVRLRFTDHVRAIELIEGQALFEVAKDPTRPFRVTAGAAAVVAVGTQFDVYRRSSRDTQVTVIEGRVDVVSTSPAHEASRVRISAGQTVELHEQQTSQSGNASGRDSLRARPLQVRPADLRVATSWTRRELIFQGELLATVVDEVNRYNKTPIEVRDEALRQMHVRAIFNAYDTESFLEFLKQYDVKVERDADRIVVSSAN
jgi:transmembrane sensor